MLAQMLRGCLTPDRIVSWKLVPQIADSSPWNYTDMAALQQATLARLRIDSESERDRDKDRDIF